MKKFLILLFAILFMGLCAHADLGTGIYKINTMMDKLDQTEYTVDKIKDRVKKYPVYTPQTRTNTQNTQSTQNNPNTIYSNQNYNYNDQTNYGNNSIEYTQEQTIPQGNQYNQNSVFKGQASTLGELPAGTIVMDPKSVWNLRNGVNYSGEIVLSFPVFWRKLEDNHYTDGSTLLLSEVEVARYPFCHIGKGLRAWDESDVRRFLRTTFYTHLSEGFKNAIVNVNIPFADLNGNPKTINDNFFLLSIVEWGLSDRLNNGSVIKYNDLPAIYDTKYLRYVKSWESHEFAHVIGHYLTRTINKPKVETAGYRQDVFEVTDKGVLDTIHFFYPGSTVRPAVNIKSSTKVSGPYEFKHDLNHSKSLIYYNLEF